IPDKCLNPDLKPGLDHAKVSLSVGETNGVSEVQVTLTPPGGAARAATSPIDPPPAGATLDEPDGPLARAALAALGSLLGNPDGCRLTLQVHVEATFTGSTGGVFVYTGDAQVPVDLGFQADVTMAPVQSVVIDQPMLDHLDVNTPQGACTNVTGQMASPAPLKGQAEVVLTAAGLAVRFDSLAVGPIVALWSGTCDGRSATRAWPYPVMTLSVAGDTLPLQPGASDPLARKAIGPQSSGGEITVGP
ncbi:MAG TPA: hypothetical protein VHN99_10740, partial [Deinococcales bacterium]|nr:hypothetical protein [Deinococcales bacterium]